MKLKYLIWLIVLNIFWAGSYSAYKALGTDFPPGVVITLRFMVAAIPLLILWPWLPGKAPRGRDLLWTAAMGIIVFVGSPRFQIWGVMKGQAGDASVLMALEPLITAVAAAIFLAEKIPARRWFGALFGIIGILLLAQVWREDFKPTSLVASLIFICSFLCETAYSIIGKPLIERASYMKVLALGLMFGAFANLAIDGPATYTVIPRLGIIDWSMLLYLGLICSLIGYAAWYVIIQETDVNLAALTIFIQPLVGLAIAVLWLGETMHWGQLWGSVAIVVGLALGLTNTKVTMPPPQN